jgi:F-type H+-transporting ATPase subunit delta
VTSRAAGIRYARALFDVAKREGDIQQVGRELSGFAALVAGSETLARALSHPASPASKKRAVVEQLLAKGGGLSPIVSKLLLFMAERDRLVLLPDLVAAYEQRLMEHANVVRAELVTAMALPADRVAQVREGLARATGREVRLEARVDPSIIGGAVARIGSTVYDGSVTMQLQKVKQRLVESSG